MVYIVETDFIRTEIMADRWVNHELGCVTFYRGDIMVAYLTGIRYILPKQEITWHLQMPYKTTTGTQSYMNCQTNT